MSRVLVCGFEPYGGRTHNPSGEIAQALGRDSRLRTAVLPVSYRRAEQAMLALLADEPPSALLLLGMWPGAAFKLERLALNLNDSIQADADAEIRRGLAIAPKGPAAFWSTLPLAMFYQALTEAGLRVIWSRDAGAYVCNHVFYVAAQTLTPLNRPCGLIHVPFSKPTRQQLGGMLVCIERLQGMG